MNPCSVFFSSSLIVSHFTYLRFVQARVFNFDLGSTKSNDSGQGALPKSNEYLLLLALKCHCWILEATIFLGKWWGWVCSFVPPHLYDFCSYNWIEYKWNWQIKEFPTLSPNNWNMFRVVITKPWCDFYLLRITEHST